MPDSPQFLESVFSKLQQWLPIPVPWLQCGQRHIEDEQRQRRLVVLGRGMRAGSRCVYTCTYLLDTFSHVPYRLALKVRDLVAYRERERDACRVEDAGGD
jgi:hypothetical protein